jgi:adenylate cyclase
MAKTRHPILIRLRPTLLTTIVGLVLLTALAIGGGAAMLTVRITRTLIEQGRTNIVTTARDEVQQFFNTAPDATDELASLAARGALSMNDRDQLAAHFAERLRREGDLAFLGYGNAAEGWYVGAARYQNDEIVEYIADPRVNGGVPKQAAVASDGARSPPSVVESEPYLVRERPWFQQGLALRGPVWSPFYQFITGGTGITCATRFFAPGATAPTGVFHADLRVARIATFLSTLKVGKRGSVFLVDRDGKQVVTPTGEDAAFLAEAIDTAASEHAEATLANPEQIRLGTRIYELVYDPVPIEGDLGLSIGVAIDLREIGRGAYRNALIAAIVALAAILLAILCGRALSLRIARPIVAIAEDLAKVGAFSISRDPAPRSFIREVSQLGASVDRMKASLRSFAHYVPTDLVRQLLAHGREAELGGELRRLTIYFSDIANFTSISEGMEPDRLVDAVGGYLELMTGTITHHGGTVDKFIGDGVMAFFNAPEYLPDHPRQACLAALEAQRLLAERACTTPPGEPVFHTRIGLGLGEVLVGNIGTPDRFAYTLLGDEVNLASRLEGLNKLYGTTIIASETVRDEAGNGFEWRRLDRVAVKGRRRETLIYELIGQTGEVEGAVLAARDVYERALDAYFSAQFDRAGELFDEAARLRPDDLGAVVMRERSHELADDPPLSWNGIHVMEEK